LAEDRYGSGNWSIPELKENFSAPTIPRDAKPSDLKNVSRDCAILICKITWEISRARKTMIESKRKMDTTRKEIHISICAKNRKRTKDQKYNTKEMEEKAEIFKGQIETDSGPVEVNMRKLEAEYLDTSYELDLWKELLFSVKATAKEAEQVAFNLSIEGKYGGFTEDPRKTGVEQRPWEVDTNGK
jgi:hypothetical protein